MSGEVFVSYRRGAYSNDATARLIEVLGNSLGKKRILDDFHDKEVGVNVRARIQNELKSASVILVVIHPEWLAAMPRLPEANDYVRLEIEAALEFGLKIIPVLVSGAQLPAPEALPESIRSIVGAHAVIIAEHTSYDAVVRRLADDIRNDLPGRTLKSLDWFANHSAGNLVFALMILGALMLFISRMLEIHTFQFATEVKSRPDPAIAAVPIMREVGVLMAWNWVAVIMLITPAMFALFNNTLRQARELLSSMQIRRMIFYVGENNQTTPLTSRSLWQAVARPTAVWCQIFIVIAVVLGTVQWWQYSGQWYFLRPYSAEAFLPLSTGEDWNIAWALGNDQLARAGLSITVFVLAMYLVYGIGTAITFSYYSFLFNFFSELSQLAASAGSRSSEALIMDPQDRESGGLAAFRIIQRHHAAFCFWSVFAMYLMSLRNAYLPRICRVPDGVAAVLGSTEAVLDNCSSMGGFASSIWHSITYFVGTLIQLRPDFAVLFFPYSEQNLFIMGSLLHAVLITCFFYMISSRMTSIVEIARRSGDEHTGDMLLRQIRSENVRVLIIMSIGALSTVFLNLGPIVFLVALVLVLKDKIRSMRTAGRITGERSVAPRPES